MNVSAVLSGLPQYPANVPGWRVWISLVSGSRRSSVPGYGSPTVPTFTRPGRFSVPMALFSVIP